jgi:type II secretory pathway component PulF
VDVSTGIRSNLYWLGPLLIGLGAGIYYWRRTEGGRNFLDRQILRIPIIGELVRQMTTAQVSRSLATLLSGGLTLVESFDISLTSVTNHDLRRKTVPVASMIREGKPFTESLATAGWMPTVVLPARLFG